MRFVAIAATVFSLTGLGAVGCGRNICSDACQYQWTTCPDYRPGRDVGHCVDLCQTAEWERGAVKCALKYCGTELSRCVAENTSADAVTEATAYQE
jgi:hypothetical protein